MLAHAGTCVSTNNGLFEKVKAFLTVLPITQLLLVIVNALKYFEIFLQLLLLELILKKIPKSFAIIDWANRISFYFFLIPNEWALLRLQQDFTALQIDLNIISWSFHLVLTSSNEFHCYCIARNYLWNSLIRIDLISSHWNIMINTIIIYSEMNNI